jgi:hypothetical protein
MTAKPPPVPRENQTDKGPGGAPRAPKDTTKHDPEAKKNLRQQGRQGNISQNTTNQGYQQDR